MQLPIAVPFENPPPMSTQPTIFSATGTIQSHLVATAGTYVIEAAGAEGGAGARGARVSGMFYLKRGDRLKIVAGRRGRAGSPPNPVAGRGGDSLVWTGTADLPQPVKLMLSARGGQDETTARVSAAPDDDGPPADGLKFSGEADQPTADALVTQWTSGTEANQPHPSAGKARADRCGYNAGAFRVSKPGFQAGDGYVSITPVIVTASPGAPGDGAAGKQAPAGHAGEAGNPPSQTMLPQVTPRPASWGKILRKRRPPGGQ